MFHTIRIAFAAALVLGALTPVRAEDPETSPARVPPNVQAHGGAHARTVPFSQADKHRLDLQK